MKNRLTIKEFAQLSGIKASTLRYWDEIDLFSPATRSLDNNYRYYDSEQLTAVNFVTVLSNLNIPLKRIKEIKDNRNPENIVKLIEQQEKLLDLEMKKLQERYCIIHAKRELINAGMKAKNNQITVMHLDAAAFVFGPRNERKDNEVFLSPFVNFCHAANDLNINLNFTISAYWESVAGFLQEKSGVPDYFISLDPNGKQKRPAGEYLVGFARCYYSDFGNFPKKMMAYAKKHHLTLVGPVYIKYLLDEVCVKDPSQYLVQISVAVAKG